MFSFLISKRFWKGVIAQAIVTIIIHLANGMWPHVLGLIR